MVEHEQTIGIAIWQFDNEILYKSRCNASNSEKFDRIFQIEFSKRKTSHIESDFVSKTLCKFK